MKRKILTPLFLGLGFCVATSAALIPPASAPTVVPLEGNTYSVTVSAQDKFTRNTEKLKQQGLDAATQFCAREGKVFRLVSATENKGLFLVGAMASTTIVFKALNADDPEAAPGRPAPPPAPSTVYPLYDQLIKLDELHKKGLVTDEEFAIERKRIVEHSR